MGILGMTVGYLLFSALHFIQFVLAITVCGLYGFDLQRARSQGKYIDGNWVWILLFVATRTHFSLT